MDINDLYEAGGDIMDAVNDAIKYNDYQNLSDSIKKTVNDVTEAIKRDVRDSTADYAGGQDVRRRVYRSTRGQGNSFDDDPDVYRRYRSTAQRAGQGAAQGAAGTRRSYRVKDNASNFFQKKITKSNGISHVLAGAIGMVIFLPMALSNAASFIFSGGGFGAAFGLLATTMITAASAYAIMNGHKDSGLIDRYMEYGKVIGDAEYVEIEKLARATGRTRDEVLADLQKMIDSGFFKEAWIDDQKTTLMLTEEVYNQYERLLKEERERFKKQEEEILSEDANLPEEAQQILREGRSYIQTIHQFNVDIPAQEMSGKLDQLEDTMLRIVEQVREHPESAADLRKLMGYYLPTTVKLLSAYRELDRQAGSGDNVVNTKREIEEALDTINEAFENLLDSMFQEMAWDVSSDISVMQTMFRQDGLTGSRMRAQSGQTTEQREQQVYGANVGQAVGAGPGRETAAGQAQAAGQTQTAGQTQEAEQEKTWEERQQDGQVQSSGGVQMQVGGSTLVWGNDSFSEEEK